MKYFTPELYEAFQEDDDDKWEEQAELYEKRLAEIKLPDSVRLFMETVYPHDATIHSCMTNSNKFQLILRQDNWGDHKYLCVIDYVLAPYGHLSQFVENPPMHSWKQIVHQNKCFSLTEDFLYDEWDHLGGDVYKHNFLFANGVETEIFFSKMSFVFLPIKEGFVESN